MATVKYEVKWIADDLPYTVVVIVGPSETEAAARVRAIRVAENAAVGIYTPDAGTQLTMTRIVDNFSQAPTCQSPYNSGWPAFVTAVGEFSW